MLRQLVFLFFLVDVSGKNKVQMQLYQRPRFAGLKSGQTALFNCKTHAGISPTSVEWLKASSATDKPWLVTEDERVILSLYPGYILLVKVEPTDSGVYFCRVNGTLGPGSELQVHRHTNLESTIRRSNMKDVIMFLQAFLLATFLLISKLCYKQQAESEETIYEEPEDDHTYEGLDIEHCALYEDIPAFMDKEADAEPCDMESPDQE